MLPNTRRRSRVLTTGLVGLALLGATLVPPAAAAPAQDVEPAALTASGPFSAAASTELLRLDAVEVQLGLLGQLLQPVLDLLGLQDTTEVADLGLAHTNAQANSAGGAGGVDDDRTFARAANLEPADILDQLSIQDLLSVVSTGAPASGCSVDLALDTPGVCDADFLDLDDTNPIAALLTAGVSNADVTSNWVSDTECVSATTPLSVSTLQTAGATLLGAVPGGGLLNTGDGVTRLTSTTDLPATGGPNDQRAIRATTVTQLAELNLLGGAVSLAVEEPAVLTVQATGQEGGATYSYTPPVLVDINSNDVIDQATLDTLFTAALGPLFGVLEPLIDIDVTLGLAEEGTLPGDGTTASATFSALTLNISLLDALGEPAAEVLTLDLLPMRALATAPAGGIFCGDTPVDDSNPLELQKVHSGPAVPGSSFDYSIAVGNVGDCVLNPVSVTDTLLGPAGTQVVLTEPAGAQITPIDGGFRITWDNVGPIAPDGRTTLRIRVSVPANAPIGDRYNDTFSSTGTVVGGPGCTPRDVSRTDNLPEPEVVGRPSGPCNITGSTKSRSHEQVYPGESFVYFVNVLNGGGENCTNVTVTDAIDDRLTFEACSDNCTFSDPNVTWNIGTLAPGQSVTLRLQVKVNAEATGELLNVALIDTDQTPPHTVRVNGPLITTNSILAPGDPARIPNTSLARTGLAIPMPVALGLALLGLAAWQVRRRALPLQP